MDTLTRERRLVNKATFVGSLLIAPVVAFAIVVLLLYAYAFLTVGQASGHPISWWALVLLDSTVDVLSHLNMQLFLWHFSRDAEPFDSHQSFRLLFVGILFVMKTILSGLIKPYDPIEVFAGPPPIGLTYSGVRIGPFSMAVFVICVALVLRYGNALKQDSDSFL